MNRDSTRSAEMLGTDAGLMRRGPGYRFSRRTDRR
jgi:hypothetical protein